MTDVIYFCGARGGAGVTTCALRLSFAFASLGERTLYLDGDCECASGLEMSGLAGMNLYTLADAESGACRIKQCIVQHPSSPNLYILPTLGCKNQAFTERAAEECLGWFDRVILDGAARNVSRRIALVTPPYFSYITSAKNAAARLKDFSENKVGLIVNKINGGLIFDGEILTPEELSSLVRIPLWGIIPEDLSLPLQKIKPTTSAAFNILANYLLGKTDEVLSAIKSFSGVGGAIKRRLRKTL